MASPSNRDWQVHRTARILRLIGYLLYVASFALPASFQIGRDQTLRSGFALFLGAATMCVPAIFGVLISLATLSITELQMGVIATSVIANIPMIIIFFRSRRTDKRPLGCLVTWQLAGAIQASLVALMPSISLRQIAWPYLAWVSSLWVIFAHAYLADSASRPEKKKIAAAASSQLSVKSAQSAVSNVEPTPPEASASSPPSAAVGRP